MDIAPLDPTARRRSLGAVLGDALALVVRNPLPLFGAAFLFYAPYTASSDWLGNRWLVYALSQGATDPHGAPSGPRLPPAELVGTMLGGLLLMFLLSVVLGVTVYAMAIAVRDEASSPSVATWLRGLRRGFAYAIATILVSIATTLAMAPLACGMGVVILGGGIAAGGFVAQGGSLDPGALVLLALIALPLLLVTFVLSLLPALYLSGRWIAAIPLVVERSAGPITALRSSWRLTSANPWRSLGFVVLLGLIFLCLLVPVSIGTSIPAIATSDGPVTPQALSLPRIALNAIFGAFAMSFTTMSTVLYYDDLRAREIERAAGEVTAEVGSAVEAGPLAN